MAGENIDPELFLELDDRLGHARLGREQRLGRVRQVEILAHCLAHEAQLMEVHCRFVSDLSPNVILCDYIYPLSI
jgi:hypothetical protein